MDLHLQGSLNVKCATAYTTAASAATDVAAKQTCMELDPGRFQFLQDLS